jgi:ABC-type glycerol-3-phosphate transport system substrate-binding protein
MWYKKKYVKGISTLVVLVLFACNSSETQILNGRPLQSSINATTVNLVGHWRNEGDREHFVRNIARAYEFENQHIKLNLTFPEETYYDTTDRTSNEKYLARVVREGLNEYDILRINGEYSEVYHIVGDADWAKKTLVDFSNMEEFRSGTVPELLTDKALQEWNGMIPGPFVEGQYWAVFSNLKVAEKLGIQIKQFGMTADDFMGYLSAVNQHNKNNPNDYIIPIFESGIWETTLSIAINLFVSELADPQEFLNMNYSDNRLKAWYKTLQAVEAMALVQPLHPEWKTFSWDETTHRMMPEGKCLFYVNGSWMYNIWKGLAPDKIMDIIPCEYPAFKPHQIYPAAYQVTWGVPKNAINRDEAIKFLLALNKPSIAEKWSRYTKCPTGIKGNLASESLGGDHYEIFSRNVQNKFIANRYRYYESNTWVYGHNHPGVPLYFREVIEGQLSADEAYALIQSNLNL